MKQDEFYVIKCHTWCGEMFFTGGFKKRRFRWLCKLLGIHWIVPSLSPNKEDAEFHLSPTEADESVTKHRMTHPDYQWYRSSVELPMYTNEAMLPRFCIIIKHKERQSWRYYQEGATDEEMKFSTNISDAAFVNLDEAKTLAEAIQVNHKEWHYQVIPTPERDVHADALSEYLKKNPPRPIYMTFRLKKKYDN